MDGTGASRRIRCLIRALALGAAFIAGSGALAQTYVFQIDPRQSHAGFSVDATLHTVHGTFQFKSGDMQFDTSTGAANGLLVLDAATAETGNSGRDRKMHREILESGKYPQITFAPQHIRGVVPQEGKSEITIDGVLTLHGQPHPITISAPVEVHSGRASAEAAFVVPYVQWGLKNPSTFVLRVSDKVKIDIHAVGTVAPSSR